MKSWTVDPKKFSAETKKDFSDLLSAAALTVYSDLVNTTPVDTGRAKSNWIPSIGSPVYTTRPATDSLSVILQAQAVFEPDGLPEFPVLYIANSLDYIASLNMGSSQQAPAGFVEMAVNRVF